MTNFKVSAPARSAGSSVWSLPPHRPPQHHTSSKQALSLPPASGIGVRTPGGLRAAPPGASLPAAGEGTPAQAFEAARIQAKRGAIKEALALAEQASIAEPEQPRYRALHAWLRAEHEDVQPGPLADEILRTLTGAVRQLRTDLEIRLYRGRVLSRLGRREEAIRDFSVVASMDEKNLEAVREVRLHRAREDALASGVYPKYVKRP